MLYTMLCIAVIIGCVMCITILYTSKEVKDMSKAKYYMVFRVSPEERAQLETAA